MNWLFIIDPIENLNYKTDSTYAIMKEAYRQGIEVFFCCTQDIFFKERIKCVSKSFSFTAGNYTVGAKAISKLDSFNIIFMRKDPPYDMTFHYCTELLSIPEVRIGDKRILVLGGKIIGAVLREPKDNNFLANLGQGGIARKTDITERENEMVTRLSKFLIKNGLHFVGLDVIGDYMTEINITCPTGIVHINQLNNTILEKEIVEYFRSLADVA